MPRNAAEPVRKRDSFFAHRVSFLYFQGENPFPVRRAFLPAVRGRALDPDIFFVVILSSRVIPVASFDRVFISADRSMQFYAQGIHTGIQAKVRPFFLLSHVPFDQVHE